MTVNAELVCKKPPGSPEAIVTGAAEKGTWVRLLQPPIEGRLAGGFEGMDVGHRLRVQLISTDVERG